MAKYGVEDIRNIALCGHGGAGKTTLIDTILNHTGTVNKPGSVDDGSSICDFDDEEKTHKYTIEATVTHFTHKGKRINMIDTPGYPDFIGQTIGALQGVDTAMIVVNAQSGIEVNTRRVFAEAGAAGLGRMILINKLDGDNIDFEDLVGQIQEVFGSECVLMNVPIGAGADFKGVASTLHVPEDTSGCVIDPAEINEGFVEQVVTADEEVMERYLEGTPPTDEEFSRLLGAAIASGDLIPILCVCGKKKVGLDEMLDAMAMCALPPGAVERTAKKGDDEVTLEPKADGPLVAQVFKTRIDPFVQKLSFIRVYSGTLKTGDTVPTSGARKGVKMAQLFSMQASETEAIDEAIPGDIVAVAKCEDLHTCATLGDMEMAKFPFPTPMVGLAATPKSRGDETKLSGALAKVCEEDPTFHQERNEQTKQLVITGMSELHLQIVQERLKRRDKVEIETKEPKIPYRETVQSVGKGSYRHKKQSGGSGQFGEVHIEIHPFPEGTDPEEFCLNNKGTFPSAKEYHYDPSNNFVWIDSIVGGSIPSQFLPAIEKGFKERMVRGVIAGYQVQNVCVNVHFGKHHPVDSNETAFKTAGSMAFRNVFQEARPALLEPIVKMAVTVPADNVGDINSDLSTRRGRPLGMESAGGGMTTITAEVPLAEVTTYSRTLASVSGGQGSYSLEFARYDVVPGNVQQEIIKSAELQEEEE